MNILWPFLLNACVFPENKGILFYNHCKLGILINLIWVQCISLQYTIHIPNLSFDLIISFLVCIFNFNKNDQIFSVELVPLYIPKSSTWECSIYPQLSQYDFSQVFYFHKSWFAHIFTLLTLSDNLLEKEWFHYELYFSLIMSKVGDVLLYEELLILLTFCELSGLSFVYFCTGMLAF